MSLSASAACLIDSDCRNGGSCRRSETEADFLQHPAPTGSEQRPGTCRCRIGFAGDFCERGRENTFCTTDADCWNGGSCRLVSNGKRNEDQSDFLQPSKRGAARCVCKPGFLGNQCQEYDYDVEWDYPRNGMEKGVVAVIVIASVIAIAIIFFVLVKIISGTSTMRGLTSGAFARGRLEVRGRDGISMTNTAANLRKRRGTTTNNLIIASPMQAGPVAFVKTPGEVL
jgi:hypothetical protein